VLDAFWEEDYLSPWDIGAGLLILSEAGGVAARIDGGPIDLEDGSVLAANSSALFQELGERIRGARTHHGEAAEAGTSPPHQER
jgi:myo-inositol-1(or 4)-monophosphatase